MNEFRLACKYKDGSKHYSDWLNMSKWNLMQVDVVYNVMNTEDSNKESLVDTWWFEYR